MTKSFLFLIIIGLFIYFFIKKIDLSKFKDFLDRFFDFLRKKNVEKKWNIEFVYKKKEFLLTKNELYFYSFLKDILKWKYTIMCNVRLIDILTPIWENKFIWRSKIIQKHIDFLICTNWYLNPVLAIELNDSSHKKIKRYERDNFLDLAFQSAWLPLLFISTSDFKKKNYIVSILSDFLIF